MKRFYCDPISLSGICVKRQIFSGPPCRHVPRVMARAQLGVPYLPCQRGSGHVALDEGDVAVLALGEGPLPHRLLQDVAGQAVRVVQHDGT